MRLVVAVVCVALCASMCAATTDRASHDQIFLDKLAANDPAKYDCYGAYQDIMQPASGPVRSKYVTAFHEAYIAAHSAVVAAKLVMSNWPDNPDVVPRFELDDARWTISRAIGGTRTPSDYVSPAFLRFDPIKDATSAAPASWDKNPAFCARMGGNMRAARVSVSLKTIDFARPSRLFQVFSALVTLPAFRQRLMYSKIETDLRFLRTDAILFQLCYEKGKEDELAAVLDAASAHLQATKDATKATTLDTFVTDEGPFLQKGQGLFSVGDYTPGTKGGSTSWGADVCCAYKLAGVKGLMALIAEANKNPVPNFNSLVYTFPSDASFDPVTGDADEDYCALSPAGKRILDGVAKPPATGKAPPLTPKPPATGKPSAGGRGGFGKIGAGGKGGGFLPSIHKGKFAARRVNRKGRD